MKKQFPVIYCIRAIIAYINFMFGKWAYYSTANCIKRSKIFFKLLQVIYIEHGNKPVSIKFFDQLFSIRMVMDKKPVIHNSLRSSLDYPMVRSQGVICFF